MAISLLFLLSGILIFVLSFWVDWRFGVGLLLFVILFTTFSFWKKSSIGATATKPIIVSATDKAIPVEETKTPQPKENVDTTTDESVQPAKPEETETQGE